MKNIFIFCLIAAALAMAQRQSVVVLPSIADQDAKLNPKQLDLLTDKVRSIIPNILPLKDFNLLKQGVVEERLGEEGLYLACKEGSCVGDLVAQVQADFGARCEVLSVNKQLYLKFELYGTLKGERDAGTIDQFNDPVKDFAAMLALLDKKVPVAFKKVIAEPAPAAPAFVAPATGGSVVAQITTEPAGAVLDVNGIAYQGCPKTPCVISLYENRFKLSAKLSEYETADTNLVITMPNQLVTIKLKPKRYRVNFASQPSGASLRFGGESYPLCSQTPCGTEFAKGNVKVSAALNLHESKDTAIFVSENNQRVDFVLSPSYGTLRINPAYVKGIGGDEDWNLAINGKSYSSYENKLSPGRYVLRLTHGCYEDIADSVNIEKGKLKFYDMSFMASKGLLKAASWCSEESIGGQQRAKPDVGFEGGGAQKSTSFWVAIALDVVGAGLIVGGIAQNSEYITRYDKYKSLSRNSFPQWELDEAWQNAENSKFTRNVLYTLGGLLLASGIGVHIAF